MLSPPAFPPNCSMVMPTNVTALTHTCLPTLNSPQLTKPWRRLPFQTVASFLAIACASVHR